MREIRTMDIFFFDGKGENVVETVCKSAKICEIFLATFIFQLGMCDGFQLETTESRI